MIMDISGIMLIPGNMGRDCPGNGVRTSMICCCDECDYMLCCLEDHSPKLCEQCKDPDCPNVGKSLA